jgi:hypothetical protein
MFVHHEEPALSQADSPGAKDVRKQGILADRPDGKDQSRRSIPSIVLLDLLRDRSGEVLVERIKVWTNDEPLSGSFAHLVRGEFE